MSRIPSPTRIAAAQEATVIYHQKLIDAMLELWQGEDYQKVKHFIKTAPADLSRTIEYGVADRLEGIKREVFLNYMTI